MYAIKTFIKYKGSKTGFSDKVQFALLCKHGNEDSLGLIAED